jgi:hypothetical protein
MSRTYFKQSMGESMILLISTSEGSEPVKPKIKTQNQDRFGGRR